MIMLITSFLFMACEKEETKNNTNGKSDNKASTLEEPTNPGIVDKLVWHWDGKNEVTCMAQPMNCFEPVTITPDDNQQIYNDFVNSCSDCDYCGDFFENEDWEELFPHLVEEEDLIQDVINEEIQIIVKEYPERNTNYALFSEPGNDPDDIDEDLVIYGYPMNTEDIQ